jgi:prepilin-type N-terminal cleavage/methylation domain-containing protein
MKKICFSQKGLTLVEVVVSIAIFSFMAIIIFQVYALIINEIRVYRDKATVAALADQYIETVRNLSYADIGTIHGPTCDKPEGEFCTLPDEESPDTIDIGGVVYSIYYTMSYVDDPTDGTILGGTDAAPNDYKQVKLYVENILTGIIKNFLTIVAPKGLESLGNRGVLSIEVFDAIGQPVDGATIHIVNNGLNPTFDVTRISGVDGTWLEVGLQPSVNGYHITVSKDGYSTNQTHAISEENPNPTKPDSTILIGQVTQLSFSIDRLSSLTFNTLNQTCQIMSDIDLEVRGSKLIGTSPSIYKFDKTYISDSSGIINPVSDTCYSGRCLEWDSYSPASLEENYMIYGTIPAQPISVLPNTSQNFILLLGPKTDHSMLVIVKDSGTGNPIEGATVALQYLSGEPESLTTGGSVWGQEDWSGASDFYNISTSGNPYALRLANIEENYVDSGWLESSTFDTGTEETTYTTLNWDPTSQNPNTTIMFQIASNNDNETWNFIGPDGTSNSYYTVSGNEINEANNSARYFRYKVFLSTSDSEFTPVLTSISLNYISGCYTPGQVMFSGLQDSEEEYGVTVAKEGYQTQVIEGLSVNGGTLLEVSLTQ